MKIFEIGRLKTQILREINFSQFRVTKYAAAMVFMTLNSDFWEILVNILGFPFCNLWRFHINLAFLDFNSW